MLWSFLFPAMDENPPFEQYMPLQCLKYQDTYGLGADVPLVQKFSLIKVLKSVAQFLGVYLLILLTNYFIRHKSKQQIF